MKKTDAKSIAAGDTETEQVDGTPETQKSPKGAIKPINHKVLVVNIRGNAPLVGNKFSAEAREEMRTKQEEGDQAKKKGGSSKSRKPKDFTRCEKEATHFFPDGGCGIPATGFRQALVSACRLVGFKMTLAKLTLFIEADGFDVDDHSPLVRITKGEPIHFEAAVRNASGVADIRARPMWEPGWEAAVRVRYDADFYTEEDVYNLMERVGLQVGICAGRPDSRESCGQGWGTFDVIRPPLNN